MTKCCGKTCCNDQIRIRILNSNRIFAAQNRPSQKMSISVSEKPLWTRVFYNFCPQKRKISESEESATMTCRPASDQAGYINRSSWSTRPQSMTTHQGDRTSTIVGSFWDLEKFESWKFIYTGAVANLTSVDHNLPKGTDLHYCWNFLGLRKIRILNIHIYWCHCQLVLSRWQPAKVCGPLQLFEFSGT